MELIAGALVASGVLVIALLWLRAREGTDSIGTAAYEAAARYLPGPVRRAQGLQQVVRRRACAAREVLPSGTTVVPEQIVLRISEDDWQRLTGSLGATRVQDDLVLVVTKHARSNGWQLPPRGPRVTLVEDAGLRAGWVPVAGAARFEENVQARADTTFDEWTYRLADEDHDWYDQRSARTAAGSGTFRLGLDDHDGDENDTEAVPQAWLLTAPAAGPHHPHRQPSRPDAGRAYLHGPDGRTWDVPVTGITLGRAASCGVVLDDTVVSREHARIEHGLAGWQVIDLGSLNGTWVDGHVVKEAPQAIGPGQTLRLGSGGPALVLRTPEPGNPAERVNGTTVPATLPLL